MPNNIQNRLAVTGEKAEDIKIFLERIKSKERQIDFNNIIPMPQALRDTEESSKTSNSIFYYLTMNKRPDLIRSILRYPQFYDMDRFANTPEEELNDMYAIGEKYVNYYKEFGATTWYDWANKNWGTKWNAYEIDSIMSLDGTSVTLLFQTAWSGVSTIIAKLTEMFPELVFEYAYADEDMGYNCGTGWGQDGEYSYEYLKGGTEEAMQTFALCWDYDFDNFYKDDEGHWHNREWDEDEEE